MTSLKQRFINWQRQEPRCSLIMGDMINAVDEVAEKIRQLCLKNDNADFYQEVLELLVGSDKEEKEKQKQ